MKVLITGGYGFIGSHVADRFNKEGHQVFIVDNLSTGNKGNISFKHRFYKFDIEDKKCSEIFRSNKFDVVIHLAAQSSVSFSTADPYRDTSSNILGLTNVLSLSQKYGVKKFIFTSSAAVYGNNGNLPLKEEYDCEPVSPYAISKLTGELYCRKWHEMYGLNTLCFRLSNVYGPRQGTAGESGAVSIFMDKMINGKEIEVYGDGKQTRDFIYVEDVAEAIYKSAFSDITGVFNISSGAESSINELIEILKTKHAVKGVIYRDSRKGDILRSCLDNSNIKEELDWAPMYSLDKGIEKTLKWGIRFFNDPRREIAVTAVIKKTGFFSQMLPYIENLLGFILVLILTNLTRYDADFSIFDFKLLYIILIGIMYGTRQSTISVVLSTILYINTHLGMGRDLISLIYDPNSLLQISIYILIGISIGYTIDRKNRDIQFNEIRLKNAEEKSAFINEMYNETMVVKEELQNQIINSQDSFGKIYGIIKELDSLQPEEVFNASVSVIENIMKSDSISIYIPDRACQFLRLMARSKDMKSITPKSIRISEYPDIKNMISVKEPFINKELKTGLPLMMASIVDDNRVIAIVSIHDSKFENLTLYYQNLFKIVTGLISSSLSRAQRYEEATYAQRYIKGTRILNWESFSKILLSKQASKGKLNSDYTVLTIGKPESDLKDLSHELINAIREVDHLGAGKRGSVYILLSNTGKSDAAVVMRRLEKMGLTPSVVNEGYENE